MGIHKIILLGMITKVFKKSISKYKNMRSDFLKLVNFADYIIVSPKKKLTFMLKAKLKNIIKKQKEN